MRETKQKPPKAHVHVSIHFVRGSKEIDAQLRKISHQLKTTPSPEQTLKLTRILDDTASSLKQMKKEASCACGITSFHYFENLENEIIHMYGRLQDAVIAHQISAIQKEMENLQKIMEKEVVSPSQWIPLEKTLQQFLKDYRPGIEERRIIAKARHLLALAKNPTNSPSLPISCELAFEDYELLFDIARLLYNHKIREAKAEYYQLPERVQEAVQNHLKHLVAVPFEDVTETIQALIATVHQILGNGEDYPTPGEIEELFLGLAQITTCETPCFLKDIKTPVEKRQQISG